MRRDPKPSTDTPISSPCVSLCALTTDGEHCTGCGRSRMEIATWRRMTEPERLHIMAELPARKRNLGLVPALT